VSRDSDGNETNDAATVSDNETHNATPEAEQPPAPRIEVLKGQPTDDEVAALITVLAGASGGGEQAPQVFSHWGLPVDRLRYSIHSWQRMSLQQRAHMRGK
jgi:acyl-CoA carboxylase epsilon subunit